MIITSVARIQYIPKINDTMEHILMILLTVLMSSIHQILVSVVSAAVVAALVGFGSANFFAGSIETQVGVNTKELADMRAHVDQSADMGARVLVLESGLANTNKRLDTFEAIVISGQKEQRLIANEMLNEMKNISRDNAVNSTKIGSIEIDISEIKDNIK